MEVERLFPAREQEPNLGSNARGSSKSTWNPFYRAG